ncbi:hypothetical protein SSX86_008359 [Deinandra increscens subsp. villosa]|uniref:Dynein light chain n=1 Tax=Deinandra increscens subsp. villosa TaxID=3103831 RepID=A0AAP0DFA4_9ASTR
MATHKKGVTTYVYKLDTGNHPPEPHHHPSTPPPTATKKAITRSLGALLHRSKTYRENNHHPNPIKAEVVFDGGRRSVPATEDGNKLVSVIEKGRKTVSGTGEGRKAGSGIEAGRRSAGNRAEMVMMKVEVVAELLQVRVLVADMPAFMQVHAFRCARQSLDSLEKFSPKQIAFHLKKDFDKVYGPAWHCIVGSSFGSFVTHATGCFLYFCIEKLYILVFKTKVQKQI